MNPRRVPASVPAIEIADDLDGSRVRGPDGEIDSAAAVDHAGVGAQTFVKFEVFPFADQVTIEIAQDRRGRVWIVHNRDVTAFVRHFDRVDGIFRFFKAAGHGGRRSGSRCRSEAQPAVRVEPPTFDRCQTFENAGGMDPSHRQSQPPPPIQHPGRRGLGKITADRHRGLATIIDRVRAEQLGRVRERPVDQAADGGKRKLAVHSYGRLDETNDPVCGRWVQRIMSASDPPRGNALVWGDGTTPPLGRLLTNA